MATLDIPAPYLAVAPIVVTSPTTRCGTTLVQRLLSASDNGLVYGEEIGHQFNILTSLFLNEIGDCERNGAAVDAVFQQVLEGTLDEWRPGLAPPTEIRLRAWTNAYYQLPTTLAQFGASIDRPIWGFKWPAYEPQILKGILALMPATKVIYVIRDLVDALKSAKARRFVKTEADADGFCAQWARNIEAFESLRKDERVLFLKYETLIDRKDEQIWLLQNFTNVTNMRASEFDLKINTFVGRESEGHASSQYIAPASLTEAELNCVSSRAGALMAELYPDDDRPKYGHREDRCTP